MTREIDDEKIKEWAKQDIMRNDPELLTDLRCMAREHQALAAKLKARQAQIQERLESEDFREDMELAIAEEYMLIPKKSTWEEYGERLAQAAINTISKQLKGVE